jgi:hypothetical protein
MSTANPQQPTKPIQRQPAKPAVSQPASNPPAQPQHPAKSVQPPQTPVKTG